MTYYPAANSGRVDSLSDGERYQEFVADHVRREFGIALTMYDCQSCQYRHGENPQGFEIKLDKRCTETGRLSIEVAEKTNGDLPDWTTSGIYRDDNSWMYVQGNYDVIWGFAKKILKELDDKLGNTYEESPMSKPTVRKFYITEKTADRWCAWKITPYAGT